MLQKYLNAGMIEAGTDEAGRGCLAGPVVAAAVILPGTFQSDVLRDSKKLTADQRANLAEQIKEEAVSYGVGVVSPARIDKINILNASIEAMHKALDRLSPRPEYILVDGNRFKPYRNVSHSCVVKGDDTFLSIAAASVIAKTYRDDYMLRQSRKYPEYGWHTNMGYPTKAHRQAIREFGACQLHRQSFSLLPPAEQMRLFDYESRSTETD